MMNHLLSLSEAKVYNPLQCMMLVYQLTLISIQDMVPTASEVLIKILDGTALRQSMDDLRGEMITITVAIEENLNTITSPS